MFSPTLLTDSNQTLYTVPAGQAILQNLSVKVNNYTASGATVTVYEVPTGDTAADDTAAVKDYAVGAKDYVLIPITHLAAGGTVVAVASATTTLVASQSGGKLHTP
jgi:hypothetical protein